MVISNPLQYALTIHDWLVLLTNVLNKPYDSVTRVSSEGRERKLEHPVVDPFWNAFYQALHGDTTSEK